MLVDWLIMFRCMPNLSLLHHLLYVSNHPFLKDTFGLNCRNLVMFRSKHNSQKPVTTISLPLSLSCQSILLLQTAAFVVYQTAGAAHNFTFLSTLDVPKIVTRLSPTGRGLGAHAMSVMSPSCALSAVSNTSPVSTDSHCSIEP